MKTFKNLMVLGLTLTSLSGWAQSADETSREINAQTTITRGHIDNVLERISRQRPNSPFRASDFWPQSKDLKVKVEAALVKFEDTLEKEILAKAAYWMDQYNAIYVSQDYSHEQKAVLLKQREEFIKNQFVLLSNDYKKALSEVYALIPQYDLTTQIVFPSPTLKVNREKESSKKITVKLTTNKGASFSSWFMLFLKVKNNDWATIHIANKESINDPSQWIRMPVSRANGVDTDSTDLLVNSLYYYLIDFSKMKDLQFPELDAAAYQKLIYPQVKGTCKSTICLGLRAGEYSTLLGSIKTLIDRDMKLTLASGVELQIEGLNQNISTISSLLNNVSYPETLPFDI